ncbi:hypothetical protein EF912_21625 [Streptomyces sp. WAC07061]|nr:hypothetical protein EF912_21625 [Streptomyces sp. WAC07061]
MHRPRWPAAGPPVRGPDRQPPATRLRGPGRGRRPARRQLRAAAEGAEGSGDRGREADGGRAKQAGRALREGALGPGPRRLHAVDPVRHPEKVWSGWLRGKHEPEHRARAAPGRECTPHRCMGGEPAAATGQTPP